ncbi:hypothetical protein WH297_21935 [Ochrobactrum vermis]|uniref:Uncharacterized protein n=1 Tax=Ochrobactrum vermis TaxID=1827297 RepID=A0ABU8PLM6_9HYPH|nr:hypothetical protein [Ochrobactrum vermis]PQZ26626.1 hypothetical protein CQZ93_22265 [Ochrobactrum vermis]
MEFSRDIADVARSLWLEIAQTSGEAASIEAISLAILRERQRCATIALCVFDDEEWSDDFRVAGGLVAEAILEDGKN